jgi:glycine hydroxymethyltransferase
MDKIAEAIAIIVKEHEEGIPKARKIVEELTAKYPLK